MTDGVPTLPPWGDHPAVLASDAFLALLALGRRRQRLLMDDVMPVLRDTELTPELIIAVTDCIHRSGIAFDGGERDLWVARRLAFEEEPPPLAGGPAAAPPSAPRAAAPAVTVPVTAHRPHLAAIPRRPRPDPLARSFGGDDGAPSADPVRFYLREIGKVPLLSADDEIRLAERIEAGAAAEVRFAERAAVAESGGAPPALPEVERREWRHLVADGESARATLIEANLRLVVSIAKRYRNNNLAFLDVIQEGNLGLMRAVEKFDHTKGFKFSTYATWWIRQAVSRALADKARTIRIPVHIVEKLTRSAAPSASW